MFGHFDFVHIIFTFFYFTCVESHLSMDKVLWKRYRGKLEHRETDIVETLRPPYRDNRIVVNAPTGSPVVER